jgi:hypothetical protein
MDANYQLPDCPPSLTSAVEIEYSRWLTKGKYTNHVLRDTTSTPLERWIGGGLEGA